ARRRRITSRPGRFGSPRSTMATSSGYSSPANNPSLPSRATSTVKPAAARRSFSESRSVASSSTTSTRMPPLFLARLLNHPVPGVHPDGSHLARVAEKAQHVDRPAVLFFRLGLDHPAVNAPLDHPAA